jgi:hypothetical protein
MSYVKKPSDLFPSILTILLFLLPFVAPLVVYYTYGFYPFLSTLPLSLALIAVYVMGINKFDSILDYLIHTYWVVLGKFAIAAIIIYLTLKLFG